MPKLIDYVTDKDNTKETNIHGHKWVLNVVEFNQLYPFIKLR